MPEDAEIKNAVIESNVKQLADLRSNPSPQSAERAIKLAVETTNMVFGAEPQSPGDQLAQESGKARYDAGGKLRIWGAEKQWEVWIDGNDDDKKNADLQAKRDLVQKACDAGLRDESAEVAGKIAVREMAKVKAQRELMSLAGSSSLSAAREKLEVFRERQQDLERNERKAKNWTVTARTNFDELPEMKRLHEIRDKVLRK